MKKILVIEDNADNLELVRQILEDEGYTIINARLALQGLDILQQQTIDLVLMDISLPYMDGYEATKRIRNNPEWKELPVIAITANAMQKDYDAALKAGCNGFISKPLDESILVETLQGFLGGK